MELTLITKCSLVNWLFQLLQCQLFPVKLLRLQPGIFCHTDTVVSKKKYLKKIESSWNPVDYDKGFNLWNWKIGRFSKHQSRPHEYLGGRGGGGWRGEKLCRFNFKPGLWNYIFRILEAFLVFNHTYLSVSQMLWGGLGINVKMV